MSVPPDKLMEMIRRNEGAGGIKAPSAPMPPGDVGAPPMMPEPGASMGGMSDATTAPMSSPMSTPEPKLGNKEGAMVNLSMAMDLIEQALPSLGSESPEGQKAISVLRTLTGILGPKKSKTKELQQSEILQMLQNLPQAGGGTPEGRAMSQAPAVPNMPPMPGAGAGGAPQPPM